MPRMRFSERSATGIWTLAVGLALVSGCDSGDASHVAAPPVPSVAPSASPATVANAHPAAGDQKSLRTGPFEKTLDGIRLSIPAGWKEVELSPAQQGFIDARFQIPTAHGDVTLTYSSNGGGIETNVRRWVGQFHSPAGKQPVIGDLDIGGKKATWVDLQGEFDAGPMAAANAGSAPPVDRMLGVAIPLGSRDFYLKLTGSDAAVSDIRDAFRQFARDARPLN
ncbi:MAG TPA: hypothetical protein VFG04_26645 [Planctomycetaceae bacterium]|nr:hypothetical protein [Planctomycetaceae bacterium]